MQHTGAGFASRGFIAPPRLFASAEEWRSARSLLTKRSEQPAQGCRLGEATDYGKKPGETTGQLEQASADRDENYDASELATLFHHADSPSYPTIQPVNIRHKSVDGKRAQLAQPFEHGKQYYIPEGLNDYGSRSQIVPRGW